MSHNCDLESTSVDHSRIIDNDEPDLPFPDVAVKLSTQEFYQQHQLEVFISHLFE